MGNGNFNNLTTDLFENLSKLCETFNTINNVIDENFNPWTGIVVDNNDPDQLGRCKINVFGIFDEITDTNLLPWAEPFFASLNGDSFIVPEVGSIVSVRFLNNDIYFPRYTSKVPVNHIFTESSKTDIAEDYPNTVVLFENSMMTVRMNRLTGQIVIKNANGAVIHLGGNAAGSEGGTINCFEVKVNSGATTYGIKLDPDKGLIISDGNSGDNLIGLSESKGVSIYSASVGINMQAGANSSISLTQASINASPGIAVPDSANMGPFNALPVDPMTGLPHCGNMFFPSAPASGVSGLDAIKSDAEVGSFTT
jgi:hypothetical protein